MEESPGSTEARCRLTAGGGDPRESATENRPPAPAVPQGATAAGKGETVRQERTAPLVTGAAGQTPPGARPNRGGRHGAKALMQGCFSPVARVGRVRRAAMRVPEEWPSRRPATGVGQNPAYRPSGTFLLLNLGDTARLVPAASVGTTIGGGRTMEPLRHLAPLTHRHLGKTLPEIN